jgi:hypothetical protein
MKVLITNLLIKIIPANWYTTKKTCDIITKLCDTIIELKWFVFPTIIIVVVMVGVAFVWWCKYREFWVAKGRKRLNIWRIRMETVLWMRGIRYEINVDYSYNSLRFATNLLRVK